jgi:diaminohydroxyphosphoribosylaminopyrimidine deaminase/5-amino-6-(5-phosphoribosylamino)uracil reductase
MEPDDERWMTRALELAEVANGHTSPNPSVGAVVVRSGVCVGAGYHPRAGDPHAEVFALREAGGRARGATLYTTLEPCSHTGRTPPCADLIVRGEIARVVSAMRDPDPRVSGRGHERLRAARVVVDVGVRGSAARRTHAAYIKWKTTGIPFVTMKVAMSLDGKTATTTGESQWITSEPARVEGHRLRDRHDAILVGARTVLADDPALTTRLPEGGGRDPARIVLDTHARTPTTARIFAHLDSAPTVVVTSETADPARVSALRDAGASVWRVPASEGGVDVQHALARCGEEGILSLLLEGGSRVRGSFVRARLVDRVVAFVAPRILGGHAAAPAVGGLGFERLADALELTSWTTRVSGADVVLDGLVAQR